MKLLKYILLVVFMIGFSQQSEAQLFRGKFMQKIREDLSGKSREQVRAEQLRQQQELARRKAAASGKAPTPAKPTPQQVENMRRAQEEYRRKLQQQQAGKTGVNGQVQQRQPQQRRPQQPVANSRYQRPQVSNVKGFGMGVKETKDGTLQVVSVTPGSNAAQAGVRPGDLLAEIGGVEITVKEEYDSIVDIMGEGDQMEFKISRGGQEKDLMVQFGQLPEKMRNANIVEDVEAGAVPSARGQVDFVPEAQSSTRSNMDSVLEGPLSRRAPANYGRSAQQQIYPGRTSVPSNSQAAQYNARMQAQQREIQRLQAELQRARQQGGGARLQQQMQRQVPTGTQPQIPEYRPPVSGPALIGG